MLGGFESLAILLWVEPQGKGAVIRSNNQQAGGSSGGVARTGRARTWSLPPPRAGSTTAGSPTYEHWPRGLPAVQVPVSDIAVWGSVGGGASQSQQLQLHILPETCWRFKRRNNLIKLVDVWEIKTFQSPAGVRMRSKVYLQHSYFTWYHVLSTQTLVCCHATEYVFAELQVISSVCFNHNLWCNNQFFNLWYLFLLPGFMFESSTKTKSAQLAKMASEMPYKQEVERTNCLHSVGGSITWNTCYIWLVWTSHVGSFDCIDRNKV